MIFAKNMKISLNLLKLLIQYCRLVFPDTVYIAENTKKNDVAYSILRDQTCQADHRNGQYLICCSSSGT